MVIEDRDSQAEAPGGRRFMPSTRFAGGDVSLEMPPKIRVRFIGSEGKLNSVAMLADRVHNGLSMLDSSAIESEVVLVPRNTFNVHSPFLHRRRWEQLIAGVDIVVFIKSSVFFGFEAAAPTLRAIADVGNVLLVSSPADGVEANGETSRDLFTQQIADFVIANSQFHHDLIAHRRDPATVFCIPPATRPTSGRSLEVRNEVRTVVWENPPHHDPNFKAVRNGANLEQYQEFEDAIRHFCLDNGVELRTFGVWRDEQRDAEWEDLLLDADIAIECKSIGRRYTQYQLSKPATKIQNYMALGMPVVCDSLPAYQLLGEPAGVLFADSIEEWKEQLGKLFIGRELRLQMSRAALDAVASVSVPAIAREYANCFLQMVNAQPRDLKAGKPAGRRIWLLSGARLRLR
jgi:hypothetical protein